jgi:hypothetical protein
MRIPTAKCTLDPLGSTPYDRDGRTPIDKEVRVRANRNLGFQLLGVWLIAHALFSITTFAFPGIVLLLAVLALAAGLLILIGR